MEITSFVLGMLTIVAVIVLTVIVVGLVKISKLNSDLHTFKNNYMRGIEDLYRHIDDLHQGTHRRMEESEQNIWREFEKCGKDVTMVEKTIMNQIEETRRYVDSRLDKLASKQVLKG
jgi:predicted PurR-regulated permease PerM